MHNQFQKDLCKLRHTTAKTYLGLLGDGVAPMAYAQGSQIRLTANVSPLSIYQLLSLNIVRGNRPSLQNKAAATKPEQETLNYDPGLSESKFEHLPAPRPEPRASPDAAQLNLQSRP